MKFSQRKGHTPVSEAIQTEGMNDALRNSIWNILNLQIWSKDRFFTYSSGIYTLEILSTVLWSDFFKLPIDSRPDQGAAVFRIIRDHFFSCEWYKVYDFIEFILNFYKSHDPYNAAQIISEINRVLERELSGYRFIDNVISDITDKQEVEMLESALSDNEFPAVRSHLERALDLLSNRENPDYRNSIKESISAVESLARLLSSKPKATLDDALKIIERGGKIHPALREAFSKLYGYTSDEGGIRHAMLDEPDLSAADARYFLLTCTSFVNYLKAKT